MAPKGGKGWDGGGYWDWEEPPWKGKGKKSGKQDDWYMKGEKFGWDKGDRGAGKGKGGYYSDKGGKKGAGPKGMDGWDTGVNTGFGTGIAGNQPLNGNAPQFQPSGMFGGAPYGQFWGWPNVQPQAGLPLWTEYKADDGVPYFYNSRTGLTQWERPPEMELEKKPDPEVQPPVADEVGRDGGLDGDGRRDRERDQFRDGAKNRKGGKQRRGDGQENTGKGGKGGRKEAAETGPPGCNLFVFHLPDEWTDEDLNEYFSPHGNLVSAKVMKEPGTGRSRGFGFVSYDDRVSAATAIKKMQGFKTLGKRLKVEFKKGEQEGRGEGDDKADGEDGESGGQKKSYPDDERLIGYLRAISAKNVVQSLKESEGVRAKQSDEDIPGTGDSKPDHGLDDEPRDED